MSLFEATARRTVEAIAALAHVNPFTPARIELERAALGADFEAPGPYWVAESGPPVNGEPERRNVSLLRVRSSEAADAALRRLYERSGWDAADLELYQDIALYALFARYERHLYLPAIDETDARPALEFYRDFKRDFVRWLRPSGVRLPDSHEPETVFAFFFQVRRAFHFIFRAIFGRSHVSAALRAQVWQSVFTHDLRRYRQGLYAVMHDIPTLITGPSGTGKELVAQAIGRSRFIPFLGKERRFAAAVAPQFLGVSLVALSPTLIESELFGHRRGAFTGASEDRVGYLEACGEFGTVFLDEIGELDASIQVKLLRVLQSRSFQRIGETKPRRFSGKIIAATNQDLGEAMHGGRFREDLYYRLCADRIETPTLYQRITEDRGELSLLIQILSRRIAGPLGDALAADVDEWIEQRLDPAYPWPGNVRELEQCIRNVMVRREYWPSRGGALDSALDRALLGSGLRADALLDRYVALVYSATGSYVETGRRLGLDRRTVKDRARAVAGRDPGRAPH